MVLSMFWIAVGAVQCAGVYATPLQLALRCNCVRCSSAAFAADPSPCLGTGSSVKLSEGTHVVLSMCLEQI